MLSDAKIFNLVHFSGYKMSVIPKKSLGDSMKEKFPTPSWLDMTHFEKDPYILIEPIEGKKMMLKKFEVSEVYIDIIKFWSKYDHLHRDELVSGESLLSLFDLINKYGWMNWADESIDFRVYNHLEKYVSKKINISPVPAKNIIDPETPFQPDSILDSMANEFLERISMASECIDEWINIIHYIFGRYPEYDYSKYMGMSGIEEEESETKIKPYSLGSSLILFHKLRMSKYSIGQCKVCDDIFIQKRNTGIYCSNRCRVKSYKNRKLTL